MNIVYKILWVSLGFIFLAIASLRIIFPILPTVPFLLLTSYCFLKGSERLHTWFISIKYVGSLIKDWEEHKRIPVRAKILATSMIVISMSYLVVTQDKLMVRIILLVVAVSVIVYILTRKSK